MFDFNQFIYVIIFMGSLGVILGLALSQASKRLFVYEDPRINEVEDLLPSTNCGACGTAGCRQFAEKVVIGDIEPGECTVNPKNMNIAIASFLGVGLGDQEKRVARLACGGGNHVAKMRAEYKGMSTCQAASVVSGGGKGCAWGCLGLGDCKVVCDFDAITMDYNGLPIVNEDLCTACNDCVEVCPKNLFEIHEVSHQLWVACKNLQFEETAERECEVACTACERCVVDSVEGLISIENNLAIIDYSKNDLSSKVAIERCPTGAIVWLDKKGQVEKGHKAKPIIRKEALPLA